MSTLTIELDSATENSLKRLSLHEGRKQEEVAARLISGAIGSDMVISSLEIDLMQRAREELSETCWKRYRRLRRLLKAEQITPEEYLELVETGERIEIQHVKRLEAVRELAKIWDYDFEKTRKLLGVGPKASG